MCGQILIQNCSRWYIYSTQINLTTRLLKFYFIVMFPASPQPGLLYTLTQPPHPQIL